MCHFKTESCPHIPYWEIIGNKKIKMAGLLKIVKFLTKIWRFLKFMYSEKATNFCKISTLLLFYVVPVKSKVEISQNFVAFSEYMNFTKVIPSPKRFLLQWEWSFCLKLSVLKCANGLDWSKIMLVYMLPNIALYVILECTNRVTVILTVQLKSLLSKLSNWPYELNYGI